MITWNTDNDLQHRIAPKLSGLLEQIAANLRQGKPVADLDAQLTHLHLISQASVYWNANDYPAVRTYLKLNP